ncbi:lytic murein transglycosylase [Roseovarius sp.]|uniref:lytic murein transglycosylase n=1 Tax=Roseovarius sp. TaxID=1486281 RepID=UPI002639B6A5|nr:lytic murein transglycosylase [Roseovarius sp.]MDM8167414.1 lytic murein transglycosylase [Roseovarius sp.]
MSSELITGLMAAFVTAGMALASPVETSLRPKARPGGSTEVTAVADTQATVYAGLARSIRPLARPNDLDTAQEAPVSTSHAGFDRWVRGFRGRAQAQGISSRVFDAAFSGAHYTPDVIAKDRNQTEFKSNIWDYLDNAAAPPKVEEGQQAIRRHDRTLRRVEQRYGVDKEVVAAVWGLESRYGTRMGTYPMVDALATLAFDGRRGSFFEKQLVTALKIVQSGDVTLRDFKGSWAGAMGHTQFIPTSYMAYAVDFDGDGKRDVWSDDPGDALASTAAYLRRFGWISGQPWGVEVRVPRGLGSTGGQRMPSQWAKLGVVGIDGRPVRDHGSASLLMPAGRNGAAFLVFKNFSVIKRYNNSDAYALGVGHLSDRLKGGPPIQGTWPRGYEPLSFTDKMELQRQLKRRGYDLEKIDGLIGPNTRSAIVAFQRSAGMTADGNPSQEVLKRLKGG